MGCWWVRGVDLSRPYACVFASVGSTDGKGGIWVGVSVLGCEGREGRVHGCRWVLDEGGGM